ncbi:MAG: B12-binding domain-containing protein [Phycisphaerales bacterium]
MNQEVLIERFFQTLINGDRNGAREIVQETMDAKVPAERLLTGLYYPTLKMIRKLYRSDQLTTLAHHFATRLLRSLVDQAQLRLARRPRLNRRVLVACGETEPDEIASIMAADLVEAGGFEVTYCGGGVAADEIMARVGEDRPDILLLFSSAATDLPGIRNLIDTLHDQGVCPNLQIVTGGGVYARAEGLAEEIGADLNIVDLETIVEDLVEFADQRATPDQRTVGRKRRAKTAAA